MDKPTVDFSNLPEVAPYLTPTPTMQHGGHGKYGYLKMVFEQDETGRSVLRELARSAPLIVQQALYFDKLYPELPCVYILSAGGPNIDGDRYYQDITLKSGAIAWISTGAATKIAEMRYNYSGLRQAITLEENAYLEYIPEQIIPCRHARFVSETTLTIHPTATIIYSEIFTSGRKFYADGESFDYDLLSICTCGQRPNGKVLFHEKMVIRPAMMAIRNIGMMHNYEIFAGIVVMTPSNLANTIYELTDACINSEIAIGVSRLPNDAGLIFRILGNSVETVKKEVRGICALVRKVVKRRKFPSEFPWR
jgi:urease accessory protein